MSDDKIDANRAAIAACVADGMKIADIAARIGLSVVEVRAYTYVFDLPKPTPQRRADMVEARRVELRRYAEAGLTSMEAAQQAGVSCKCVLRYAKKFGFRFKRAPHPNRGAGNTARAGEIARRFKAGDTLESIGVDYGISRERVRQILKKMGMTSKDGGFSQRLRARRAAAEHARESACLARHGCTLAQWRELKRIGKEMMAAGHGKYVTPLGAFQSSRGNAKQAGAGFNLTLWEWWQAWQQAGVWEQRGRGHGYGMTRIDKTKPYEVGNLRFETGDERMVNANKAYHACNTMEAA